MNDFKNYVNVYFKDNIGLVERFKRKMQDPEYAKHFNENAEEILRKCDVEKKVKERWLDKFHALDVDKQNEILRFYPSSKLCECGYKNEGLKLSDREWVCPECGKVHDRDINAARNILRRGIDELKSDSKTGSATADGQSRLDSRIPLL